MRPAVPVLGIRLLGDLELRADGRPLPPLDSGRAESLLAYLLLNRHGPQSRERIAALLWPESTGAQARTNLRHVLHNLRRGLGASDRYLQATPRTLRWAADESCWLDVEAFESAVAAGDDRAAVDLYRGDLLANHHDEWLDSERQRLRGRLGEALYRMAEDSEPTAAIGCAERLLRLDPLAEEAYRLLMRLHAGRGDRARALQVYHACAATLDRELGVRPSPATTREYTALVAVAPATAAPAVPLIGRAEERTRLITAWHAAAAGAAGLVLVTGEPGIGKTRLVEAFGSWCLQHGAATATAGAYPAEGDLSYGLLVDWLRSPALGERVRRLAAPQLTDLARLLPELLDEQPRLPRPLPRPENEQRQRLFDAVAAAITAPGAPVLLVGDDLHWADRESLRFLHYLLRTHPGARLLVAATARREDLAGNPAPAADHPLTGLVSALAISGRVTELALNRFSRAEAAELVAGRPVDLDRLYAETEGNPLFLVEALRAGWSGPEPTALTPRVQAVIESRLAQLSPPARDLVGIAATIGRDFTVDVLADAYADDDALMSGLDELWRRGIVRERGVDAYDFSHGRIRDAAYQGLMPARRRRYHQRVADALHRRHGDAPGPASGRIAGHLAAAGATGAAVEWYAGAAEAAQRLYAHADAVRLLDRALDLLRTEPAGPDRDTRELALLTALAAPLSVVESFASPRLAQLQERALRLAGALAVQPAPPLVRALAVASLSRGDFTRAERLGEQLRARAPMEVPAAEAEYVLGIADFWRGRFVPARAHFEAAVDSYRPEDLTTHLIQYGLDPRVVCLSRLANTLAVLGEQAAAVDTRDAALALAAEAGHPPTRSTALVFAALLSIDLRDEAGFRRYAAALTTGRGGHDAKVTMLGTEVFSGYVDVLDGRHSAGLARIQRALAVLPAIDPAPGARASYVRVLLAACAVAGDARTGLAAADRALAGDGGVAAWESEVRRLRAGFLAATGAPADVVAAERERAVAVAERQGARLFAARAGGKRPAER